MGWGRARNLLCVRLDDPGGVLATTPAIRALRRAVAGRRITLLASKAGARVAAHVPEIDEVIAYDAPWTKHELPPRAAADLAMRYVLGPRGFQAAVIFTARSESPAPAAMLCQRAGIPLRLGHGPGDAEGLLTDWVPEGGLAETAPHEVRRQLGLVAAVGAATDDETLSFRVRPQAAWRARIKLEEAGLDPRAPFIAVHPGAAAGRRWPAERFAQAAAALSKVLDMQVAVTGEAAGRALAESVRRGAGDHARSLAGSLTLEELAATLERAGFALTTDVATATLARAVGTPVVDPGAFATAEGVVAAACDLWLDIHWRAAA